MEREEEIGLYQRDGQNCIFTMKQYEDFSEALWKHRKLHRLFIA